MLSSRSTGFACLLAAALFAVACTKPAPPPSILLITVAGWPAAAESAPPTPVLDGLRSPGRAEADEIATITSTDLLAVEASLQTGLGPLRHGLRGAHDREVLAADARTLAEAARAAGAKTGAFVAAPGLMPRLGRGFDATGGDAITRRRSGATVVDEALAFLAGLPAGQRFYLWVQLDARDDTGGIDGLGDVDAAVGRLLAALDGRGSRAGTVVAAAGTVGEPRAVALLEPTAIRVHRRVTGPAAERDIECGAGVNAVAAEVAYRAGLAGIACEPVTAPDALATARRFGLSADPSAPDPAGPGPVEVSPDLAAELVRLGLPAPLGERRLVRAGDAAIAPHRQAVLDQELARIRQRAGHVASARALYERALAADPLALEALVETVQMAATSGDVAGPQARLEAALPSYRARPEIYHALAHAAFLHRAHARALACARAAALFSPDDLDLSFDIAVNAAALGQHAEALASLERAVALGLSDVRLLQLEAFTSLHAEPAFLRIVERLRKGA